MEDDLTEERGGAGSIWTDEKHTSFLNCLEDSFVRWMMVGGRIGAGDSFSDAKNLRLDRYMPDGEDSTQDCRLRRSGIQRIDVPRHRRDRREIGESHGKTRKHWHRRQAVPRLEEDQVVPSYHENTAMSKTGRRNHSGTTSSASSEDRRSLES